MAFILEKKYGSLFATRWKCKQRYKAVTIKNKTVKCTIETTNHKQQKNETFYEQFCR